MVATYALLKALNFCYCIYATRVDVCVYVMCMHVYMYSNVRT